MSKITTRPDPQKMLDARAAQIAKLTTENAELRTAIATHDKTIHDLNNQIMVAEGRLEIIKMLLIEDYDPHKDNIQKVYLVEKIIAKYDEWKVMDKVRE